jgi:hypothetical protein
MKKINEKVLYIILFGLFIILIISIYSQMNVYENITTMPRAPRRPRAPRMSRVPVTYTEELMQEYQSLTHKYLKDNLTPEEDERRLNLFDQLFPKR